jgi:hypothetical protein
LRGWLKEPIIGARNTDCIGQGSESVAQQRFKNVMNQFEFVPEEIGLDYIHVRVFNDGVHICINYEIQKSARSGVSHQRFIPT